MCRQRSGGAVASDVGVDERVLLGVRGRSGCAEPEQQRQGEWGERDLGRCGLRCRVLPEDSHAHVRGNDDAGDILCRGGLSGRVRRQTTDAPLQFCDARGCHGCRR